MSSVMLFFPPLRFSSIDMKVGLRGSDCADSGNKSIPRASTKSGDNFLEKRAESSDRKKTQFSMYVGGRRATKETATAQWKCSHDSDTLTGREKKAHTTSHKLCNFVDILKYFSSVKCDAESLFFLSLPLSLMIKKKALEMLLISHSQLSNHKLALPSIMNLIA